MHRRLTGVFWRRTYARHIADEEEMLRLSAIVTTQPHAKVSDHMPRRGIRWSQMVVQDPGEARWVGTVLN